MNTFEQHLIHLNIIINKYFVSIKVFSAQTVLIKTWILLGGDRIYRQRADFKD